jgi:DNA-3-methyladenine glycosylase I
MQEEFSSFDQYSWQFIGGSRSGALSPSGRRTRPTPTPSTRLSNHAGSEFVGSTVISALMQATGTTNDHVVSYPRQAEPGGSSPRAPKASKRA